jgi:ferredoxin
MPKRERTPLNSTGDFYVEKDMCLACFAPEDTAPDLIAYDHDTGCYFKKQPETDEELDRAIEAVEVSCIAALRYCGNNPHIIQRLRKVKGIDGEERCDVLE